MLLLMQQMFRRRHSVLPIKIAEEATWSPDLLPGGRGLTPYPQRDPR
jgi:hypothetical protein